MSQAQDDRGSLSAQDREMVEYCESQNYEVVKKYVDPGYKGWSRHRPGFREMLDDMETGAVDVVVMWHSDRLFRDFKPMVMVDEALRQSDGRVRVESVRDYIDMDTLPIQAMSARAYIRCMGRRGKARRGIMSGPPKYGYRSEGEKDVRHKHMHPESGWITIPYPPLIDERAFEKVQRMRLHPTRQRSAKKYFVKFVLKGLVFCGTCGRRYSTGSSKDVRWAKRNEKWFPHKTMLAGATVSTETSRFSTL